MSNTRRRTYNGEEEDMGRYIVLDGTYNIEIYDTKTGNYLRRSLNGGTSSGARITKCKADGLFYAMPNLESYYTRLKVEVAEILKTGENTSVLADRSLNYTANQFTFDESLNVVDTGIPSSSIVDITTGDMYIFYQCELNSANSLLTNKIDKSGNVLSEYVLLPFYTSSIYSNVTTPLCIDNGVIYGVYAGSGSRYYFTSYNLNTEETGEIIETYSRCQDHKSYFSTF